MRRNNGQAYAALRVLPQQERLMVSKQPSSDYTSAVLHQMQKASTCSSVSIGEWRTHCIGHLMLPSGKMIRGKEMVMRQTILHYWRRSLLTY